MDNKTFAIWVLAAALFGAIISVPGLFLGDVLGGAIVVAVLVAIVCALINWRKSKNRVPID